MTEGDSLARRVPRRPTGSIESYPWKDGRTVTWRLRFRAYGKRHRVDLGTDHEGWNEDRAQVELERIMGQVERGTWEPASDAEDVGSDSDETIHVTVSRWWQRKKRELTPNGQANYRWQVDYLLAELAHVPTAELTTQRVDELRDWLLRRGLSPTSVNMVLSRLAQILDDAVEYGLCEVNVARGRRRRLRQKKPPRNFLEPDMVVDLLDVAGEWEASLPRHQRYGRRALLALICLAGPRISEVITADRGDFDLAAGRWRIPAAKTDGGERDVELTMLVADELREHVAARGIGIGHPMWPTWKGGRLNPSNIRNRLLQSGVGKGRDQKPSKGVVERVNERRAQQGKMLLPERVTPHALRRTFASLALTAGRDPRWVMGQLGHTDARLTLSVYAQVVQRQRVDRELVWRLMRFSDESEDVNARRASTTDHAGVAV
jgi:integrase